MHGPKPHKGLLKRIRITKTGKVKVRRSYGRHLRSHKPGSLLRSYRKPSMLADCELPSIGKLLHVRLSPNAQRRVKPQPDAGVTASEGKAGAPAKSTTRKTTSKKTSRKKSAATAT